MKDTQVKPPTSKLKSKTSSSKVKMPAKKLKDQKVKSPKVPKTKKPCVKVNKKPKTEKVETNATPKRKRGRPRLEDKTQNKKKIKEQQKPPKSSDNKSISRKRKISQTIKGEKETSHTPPKKLKTNDTNCTMNGNIKGVLPNFNKLCNQKGEMQSSPAEHTITNHVNTNGTLHCKKSSKQPVNNFILKSATFIPPPTPPPKKEMLNGKSCLKTSKTVLAKDAKATPKSEPESSLPTNTVKEIKTSKPNNIFIPFKEPMKLHPQRMASLDAMAKLHVICIPDRKPIEHHSRTTTSVVTVCSQPSTHQKSVTQVHERIHFDVKKEGKDCKGNIVHKQINYVKEKQEVFVSHSVEESSVVEEPKTSTIKSEKDTEKKKKPKSTSQSTTNNNTAQKKSAKLNQSTLKSSLVPSAKSDKSKTTKKADIVKKSAKSPKVLKDVKKPSKEKQISKGNNHKTKKLEQTKSEVKVKETIRMQKTCTYQSVTTVNSHGTTNSSVVPVSHVGLTTNYSKTKKTVVTDEECKNNLNYSSGSVINKSYCVTSESPCSLGHQTDCCKFHSHTSPQIIPFAHVQTCTFGHGLNRTSDASSSSSPHCDGNYAIHRFGHQQPLIYTSPSQECGCCCTGPLVQNVRDSCILRKSIMTYPHHFSRHTHLPAGAFSHDTLCTEYHPSSASVDATKHAQHFSLTPSSSSHSRISCCSYCELHPGGNQCHHQSSGNCLQFMSAPKSSSSIVSCEPSPLDLSLASTSSGSSLEVDHSLQQGHCPSPLCCTGEVLLLRTSTPHNFQHTTFSPKSPCCRCNKQIACENPSSDSVQQVQCSSKSFENQSHQLVENIALSSPAAPKELLLPPVSPASKVASKDTSQVDDNFVQAKLEKNISPKQSSKTIVSKKRQFSHGWSWKGKPKEKLIAFTNDSSSYLRICYPSVQHKEGDVINERDCVLLKSGPKDTDLPYVAKVTSLWENPEDGEMMMSLLWYYRPEHTDQGRKLGQMEDEVFASRHKDVNSIACIEDKCYVLTYNEYCRYRASLTMEEDAISVTSLLVPELPDHYSRKNRLPVEAVSSDIVFFCRHVYDFRQKRILKNPT